MHPISFEEHKAHLQQRDREEEDEARAWMWPNEDANVHDRNWRLGRLHEYREEEKFTHYWYEDGKLQSKRVGALPRNDDLLAPILADPDDAEPRRAFAVWLRSLDHAFAPVAAAFLEGQLKLAASFERDPRVDIRDQLPADAFSPREQDQTHLPDQPWWRYPALTGNAMYDLTNVLEEVGLIADGVYFRGFVEHVAIKASRFLEIADELYSLAPIRQLTITYCKGPKHDDQGLLRALLSSPHLDRIRALKIPVRKFGWDKGDATELNRLTDDDVALIAESDHMSGLRVLDLEDQQRLTIRAFDAIATSRKLPELSAVRYDLNDYSYPGTFSFGRSGQQVRELRGRPLKAFTNALEARHGWIPWLQVAESYGSESPDVEAVIEHPVAITKRTTPPKTTKEET